MVSAFVYLGIMLAVICLWFVLLKRPVYEGIFISLIVLVAIANKWTSLFAYVQIGLKTSLLYSMVVFVAMSLLLSKTKVIDSSVNIILALLGRVPGGAGYVSVIASAFMGSLSGSGPGNVMSTGVITIPAMKKSGFPAELAANIESNASFLGNMIPPSSNIVAALGAYLALYPTEELTIGQFWIVCWGCSLWFILLKLVMVFCFCKYYKLKPIAKEDLPSIKETLKTSWKGLLLPIIIIIPFLFDFIFKDGFIVKQLGKEGAKYFSSSLLFFVAGVATIFSLLITKDKKSNSCVKLINYFGEKIKSIAPVVGTCLLGYIIGALFNDLNVADGLKIGIDKLNFGKFGLALIIPLFSCFLGMVIPGSSIVVIFGSVFISLFASVGINPLLIAAMLPCICGVMSGITPPLALGMYAGMSIAESDFDKTVKNDLWWVVTQYILEVVVLLQFLPILGL